MTEAGTREGYMSGKYVLDGREPRLEPDVIEWARWMEQHRYGPRAGDPEGMDPWRVGSTHVGESWISTVFLGLDHQFGDGPPMIFETLVFNGALADEQERYSTWDEAERGHEAMVKRVRASREVKPGE